MTKLEFVLDLTERLGFLPWEEVEERVGFYIELIDDRMEDGLSEEDAVAAVGPAHEIAAQILADTPLIKIAKERITPKRRLHSGEIMLLALGSPIWLSLAIAAAAVVFSLYLSLWAILISLWAVFGSLAACFIGGILACIIFSVCGNSASGVAVLAAGIVCAGLSIFMFFGCKAASKGILILTKKLAIWIKNCFIRKEEA